jgi:hypothetical protein
MAEPQGLVRTPASHKYHNVISIYQIQKTKITINSFRQDLSKTIKTFSSWYGDLMHYID